MTDETVYRVSLLVPVQIEERAGSPEEAQTKAIGRQMLWVDEPKANRPVTVCIGMPEVKTVIEATTATDAVKQ